MFEIKLIFYSLSRMLQFSQFVWALSYSVLVVFNNFLLIDATARSKISSDQKRFFIALSLYLPSFFANTPFKYWKSTNKKPENPRYFSLFLFLKIIRIYKEERLCAKLAIQSSNQQVSTINEKDKYIFYLLLYNKTRHSYIYF